MRYAPDKDDPYPKPKPKPTGNNGGGNGGKGGRDVVGFMPGEIKGLANDMVLANGGSQEKWEEYLRDVYSPTASPKYVFGGKGGNGGGKNNTGGKPGGDPTGTSTGTRPDVANPHGKMMAPYGVMAGVQPGAGVMSGIPMMQQPQAVQSQPMLPTGGVMALLRNRMGR